MPAGLASLTALSSITLCLGCNSIELGGAQALAAGLANLAVLTSLELNVWNNSIQENVDRELRQQLLAQVPGADLYL